MRLKLHKPSLFLVATVIVMFTATVSQAQEDSTPKQRLRSPATVRGGIGGEAHDSYVIRARKGQIMTVQISWRREGDNNAGFTITKSPDFFSAEPIDFGNGSDGGKRWSGKIPTTRNYYIYVTGHPIAHYTLRVKLR